ncbi:hypothetical protein [Myxococcus xanthus]|uniref:hypothetical protein n=1 Tax=Myxococcus xanthus TaxID=34 RepID=UPI0011277949|nr:hypothetical protein [Myxococcus xanthus]
MLDALNKFLRVGSVPKGVESSSILGGLSKEGMQAMVQEVAARAEANPPAHVPEQGSADALKRPWWKFW